MSPKPVCENPKVLVALCFVVKCHSTEIMALNYVKTGDENNCTTDKDKTTTEQGIQFVTVGE